MSTVPISSRSSLGLSTWPERCGRTFAQQRQHRSLTDRPLSGCLDGRQPFQRIGRFSILAYLKVQVRSSAEARVARIPEELSLLDAFVGLDRKLPQMAIDGGNSSAVQDNDHIAIGSLGANVQDNSVSGSKDGRSVCSAQIDTPMELLFTDDGVHALSLIH